MNVLTIVQTKERKAEEERKEGGGGTFLALYAYFHWFGFCVVALQDMDSPFFCARVYFQLAILSAA